MIAISSIGVVSAVGVGVDTFWDALLGRTSGLGVVAGLDVGGMRSHVGGELKMTLEQNDTVPHVRATRAGRFALAAAREALERSGDVLGGVALQRIGLVVGTCEGAPVHADVYAPWRIDEATVFVARSLGLQGPRITVSSACTAGAVALAVGGALLDDDRVDVVLAGGTDCLTYETWAGFDAMRALDAQPCSPYGRSQGLNLGEGSAFLVLERPDRCLSRGMRPVAELAGWGLSADAYHLTAPDPTGRGGAAAIEAALHHAGLEADAVDYVNGHGTGTPPNDKMEAQVIRSVFGVSGAVPVSSTKSYVGHTLGAAGAVEAAATALATATDIIPPTLGDAPPNGTGLDAVFDGPRATRVDVGVTTNYAFGGNNAALVITKPGMSRRSQHCRVPVYVVAGGEVSDDEVMRDPAQHGSSTPESPLVNGCVRPASVDANAWRRMDLFSKRCVVATARLLDAVGIVPGSGAAGRCGLIFATAQGPATTISAYHRSVRSGAVQPHLFANSATSAATGHICASFGIKGPTTVLAGNTTAAVSAIEFACHLLSHGSVETVIAVCADEEDPLHRPPTERSSSARRETGMGAAVALMLSTRPRPDRPEAEVLITSQVCGGAQISPLESDPDTYRRALDRAFDDAPAPGGSVQTVLVIETGLDSICQAEREQVFSMSLPAGTDVLHLSGATRDLGCTGVALGVLAAIDQASDLLTAEPASSDNVRSVVAVGGYFDTVASVVMEHRERVTP